jgi:DNA mismatch endonuclease (patch repair protein)
MMAKVRNRDTAPEILVRKILHAAGFRFRLYRRDLPGRPDIVLPRHRKVIFVHGCFWHGHDCPRGKRPTTNMEFWNAKLDKNIARDAAVRAELEKLGWSVLTVWECETKDRVTLTKTLLRFLSTKASE